MFGTLTRIPSEGDPVLTQTDFLTREQVREDATEEDDLWDSYLFAAIEQVEQDSRRVLCPQTWRLSLDEYPCDGVILVERCPLVSVDAFEVKDVNGDWVEVAAENYEVDLESEPGRIVKAKSGVWPTPDPKLNGIRLTLSIGYADVGSIPSRAKQAVRFLVGHWYRNRTPVAMVSGAAELSLTYQNLVLGLKW